MQNRQKSIPKSTGQLVLSVDPRKGSFIKSVVVTDRVKERMRIPRRYWEVSFKRISEGPHKETFRKFLETISDNLRRGWGLLLWGENDNGKTSMAALALMVARRHGFTGMFITAQQYISDSVTKSVFDDSATVAQRCKLVDLLVLDDFGKDFDAGKSGSIVRMYDDLLRSRSNELKSTIITTNMSPPDLKERFEQSIFSLIAESNCGIEVVGPSQREMETQTIAEYFKPRG